MFSDIYMSYLTALSDPMTWLYTLLAVVVGKLNDFNVMNVNIDLRAYNITS